MSEATEVVDPTIRQSGTIPVVTQQPAWTWRCEMTHCGWLGTGLASERAALTEALDHYWDEHNVALCKNLEEPGRYQPHPGHRWKRVSGSDSIDKCERCGVYCGK